MSIFPAELMDRYTKERHIACHSLSRLIIRTKRLLSNLRLLVIIPVCLINIQDVELIVDVALGSGDICLDSEIIRALSEKKWDGADGQSCRINGQQSTRSIRFSYRFNHSLVTPITPLH
jgi:hypothetical protein